MGYQPTHLQTVCVCIGNRMIPISIVNHSFVVAVCCCGFSVCNPTLSHAFPSLFAFVEATHTPLHTTSARNAYSNFLFRYFFFILVCSFFGRWERRIKNGFVDISKWALEIQTANKKAEETPNSVWFFSPFPFPGMEGGGSLSLINKTSCEISNSYYSVYRMVVGVHECDGFSAFTDAL